MQMVIFESVIFLHCYVLCCPRDSLWKKSSEHEVKMVILLLECAIFSPLILYTYSWVEYKNSRRRGPEVPILRLSMLYNWPLLENLSWVLTGAYVSSLCYCVVSVCTLYTVCLHVKIMFFSLGLAPSSFIFTVQSIFLAVTPEAEFLDETQTKVFRVFLRAIHSHLY